MFGQESTKRCVLTPKHVEEDQTGTERPVLVDQKEEHKIDFRVSGLSHAVVEEAEHLRVQELVKRIEIHPHREALYTDLQQNSVYNPLSKNSKAMIRELGTVQKEYHLAWNAWKRCCKKVESQGEHFYLYSRSISQRSSLS